MKRIITVFLLIVLCFQLIPFSVFAENVGNGILGELAGATVGGEAFDMEDYPKQDGASAELLAFMETGYAFNGDQSKYAMVIYVYNPSEKIIVENGNMITMAVKFDENGVAEDFEKFDLIFLEKTENSRFYKFAVEDHVSAHDGNKVVQRVDKAERRYTVSEIEMKYLGSALPTSFPVGKSFVFTGFEENENLAVKTNLVETVKLDVNSTYWRSQTSSLGIGHQNQLTSVYFSVPKSYWEKYEGIDRIKAGWNEQRTAPVFVTSDLSIYEAVNPWVGLEIGEYNANVPFSLYSGRRVSSVAINYDWTYNVRQYVNMSSMVVSSNVSSKLPYCFYSANTNVGEVTVEDIVLKEYIQNQSYADWLFEDNVDDGRIKGYQEQVIHKDQLINLESFGSTHNWWEVFWNYTIKGANAYEEFKNIAPIYEVTASDISLTKSAKTIASELYVLEDDVDELRAAYLKAEANDEKLILFRFAATDYQCADVVYKTSDGSTIDGKARVAQETVFLGFDVIWLSFFKDGVSTIIPVASSPLDVVPGITNPYVSENLDLSWIKRVLMLALIVVLIVMFWNPLMKIFGWMIDLIMNIITGFKYTRTKKRRRKRK